MTKKLKNILLGLTCVLALSGGALASTPIQSNAHSIPVYVRMTGGGYKTVYATETTNYYTVNTSVLNVRMTPNTKYAPIKQLYKGNKVKVVGSYGNWAKIETIHQHGSHYATKGFYAETGEMWVSRTYLTKATSTIHLIPLRANQYECAH